MATQKRKEEYLIMAPVRTTNRKQGAILVTPEQVIEACTSARVVTDIPPRFFVGTAQHETNFAINEIDTEPNGFVTEGIYQISREEATEVGMPKADLLDLDVATVVFTRLMEKRLSRILSKTTHPVKEDVWAYLAIAHNQGLGAALKTIEAHGLDWAAYKKRNPKVRIVSSGYGDNVITGGPRWPKGA